MVYINNYKHDVPSRRLSRDLIGLVKGHFLQRRGAHQPDAGCRIRSVDPLARCIPPSPPGTCFLIGHGPMALKKPWLQSPKSHWIWDSTQTLQGWWWLKAGMILMSYVQASPHQHSGKTTTPPIFISLPQHHLRFGCFEVTIILRKSFEPSLVISPPWTPALPYHDTSCMSCIYLSPLAFTYPIMIRIFPCSETQLSTFKHRCSLNLLSRASRSRFKLVP